jgi:hypothetical protein
MGLDMYLKARRHLANFDFTPEEKKINNTIREALNLGEFEDTFNHIMVEVEVMYWRKVNCVHKWFVDTVQKGEDDCGEYLVTRVELVALLDIVNDAIKNKDSSILPTQVGFFFGSTEIDEYYWDDLERTSQGLTKILANEELRTNYSFFYQSSW